MKKHTLAIRALKQTIKELAAEGVQTRKELQKLKAEDTGNPSNGPIRHAIRTDYVVKARTLARASLLAYGFLRGKTYRSMEPVSSPGVLPYVVYNVLRAVHQACGEDEALKAEWTHHRINSIIHEGVDPVPVEAVAA